MNKVKQWLSAFVNLGDMANDIKTLKETIKLHEQQANKLILELKEIVVENKSDLKQIAVAVSYIDDSLSTFIKTSNNEEYVNTAKKLLRTVRYNHTRCINKNAA